MAAALAAFERDEPDAARALARELSALSASLSTSTTHAPDEQARIQAWVRNFAAVTLPSIEVVPTTDAIGIVDSVEREVTRDSGDRARLRELLAGRPLPVPRLKDTRCPGHCRGAGWVWVWNPEVGDERRPCAACNRAGAPEAGPVVAGRVSPPPPVEAVPSPASADDVAADPAPGTPDEAPSQELRLRRVDRVWQVSLGDRCAHVEDSDGVARLARLLDRPGEDVPAWELLGRGMPSVAATQPILDEEMVASLEDAAEAARERGTPDGIEAAEEIEAALRRGRDVHGRPRLMGDDAEKARKAVGISIRRTLGRLPTWASAYLGPRLSLGRRCRYNASPTGVPQDGQ